jgi:hypothetical protein
VYRDAGLRDIAEPDTPIGQPVDRAEDIAIQRTSQERKTTVVLIGASLVSGPRSKSALESPRAFLVEDRLDDAGVRAADVGNDC